MKGLPSLFKQIKHERGKVCTSGKSVAITILQDSSPPPPRITSNPGGFTQWGLPQVQIKNYFLKCRQIATEWFSNWTECYTETGALSGWLFASSCSASLGLHIQEVHQDQITMYISFLCRWY